MTNSCLRAVALATMLAIASAPALADTSPKPSSTPHAIAIPSPHLPPVALHAEYVVEVNKHGQVVRIKSGKGTKYGTFNAQTYGNALQMWIRKADGSAVVGLFKVTYDYNPKTHAVARRISLVSTGGTWGDQPGAANVMIETAKKEAAAAAKQQQAQHGKLPSLNSITGAKTPSPSPVPTIPH
ncbi:MAG: hypothetical protein WB615_02940 [Candidatus Tumulicola sp.]